MSCGVDDIFDVSVMFSSNSDGTITYSVIGCPDGATASNYELDGADFITDYAGDYTIKMEQAVDDGKFNSGEATATLTVLPKYTLHITQPADGGVLSVKNGETVLTDGCEVTVGTNLTCEVTNIPEGKRFSRFYVNYDNNGEKYKATNPATFDNIPTEGITEAAVTVTYKDLAICTINYMVNGENVNPQTNVYEGTELTFPEVEDQFGKVFMGWTTTEITTPTDTKPEIIAEDGLTASVTITYYAVFANQIVSGSPSYEKISSLAAGDDIILAIGTDAPSTGVTGANGNNKDATVSTTASEWMKFTVIESDDRFYLQNGANYVTGAKGSFKLTVSGSAVTTNDDSDIIINTNDGNCALARNTNGGSYYRFYTYSTIENAENAKFYTKFSAWKYNSGTTYSDYCTTFGPRTHDVTIVSETGKSTLFLDYAAEVPEGVKAYYATAYDADNDIVEMTEVTDGKIAANQGVLLMGTYNTTYTFTETSETVTAPAANLFQGAVTTTDMTTMTGANGYYILYEGQFAAVTGGTMPAYKAYLYLAARPYTGTNASTIGFRFGDATQIENVNTVEAGKYYDLMGREVLNPAGGIYILNGKKVLVK